MTKKGPLGKAEEFYVEHHYKTNSVDEIAKQLDRPKATNKKKVEGLRKKEAQEANAGSQIARQDGIAIMTENASVISDEARKKSTSTRIRNCITSITK